MQDGALSVFLQQLVNGLAWGSIYSLIALGYTMVYGILRFINFAHGDIYMIGAYAGYFAVTPRPGGLGLGLFWGVLLAMAACALLGVIIERAAYRPLRNAPRLTVLITAIGVSLLLENVAQHPSVFGPNPRPFPDVIAMRTLHLGPVAVSNLQLLIVGASLALMVVLQLIVNYTRIGRAMRAVSYDRETAALMGVNTDTVISATFAFGSALAAAAGVLVALVSQVEPLMGIMPGIKAFVAAVLGGIGNVPGAMVGGLVLGVSEYMVAWHWPDFRDAIAFALLILILLVRPTGILGTGAVEKV
ncbi:MAG: branched-chain amino acid ABC transporter permease [Armatimonadetes bacterium]|nr:branched-chain amino acid ABC transporter permease [Armatimonadota bacterium]